MNIANKLANKQKKVYIKWHMKLEEKRNNNNSIRQEQQQQQKNIYYVSF